MDVSPDDRADEVRRLMNSLKQSLSPTSLFLDKIFANINFFLVPDKSLAQLEILEAMLCKNFDELVTESNSIAATYHALMQGHATCDRSIKELRASGNSNIVSNQVRVLQNHKARVERGLVQLEDAQCLIWKGTQELHFIRKQKT